MHMKSILLNFFIFCSTFLFAQLKPIGSWSDHLPYQSGTSMAINETQLICATQSGIFLYDIKDQSIVKWSKVNLLSEVSVQKIAFDNISKTLIVVYENANIDLIKNGTVINLPFLVDYPRITNKAVNDIFIENSIAYLACGFGVVEVNLIKNEISESYLFREDNEELSIESVVVHNNNIYAASYKEIFKGDRNLNLLDFSNWNPLSLNENHVFKKLFLFGNKVHAISRTKNTSVDSVFTLNPYQSKPYLSGKNYVALSVHENTLSYLTNNLFENFDSEGKLLNSFSVFTSNVQSLYTVNNQVFFLDNFHPLLQFEKDGTLSKQIKPNGPFERKVFDIKAKNGQVWAVAGGHSGSYGNAYQFCRIYNLDNGNWKNYLEFSEPSLTGVFDVLTININPENNRNVIFGSWGFGILEFNENAPFNITKADNTALIEREAINGWVGVGETKFDNDNNLWIANTYTNKNLSVRKADGSWKNFNFSDSLSIEETVAKELLINDNGHKWIALPRLNNIVVFDDNGTIDNIADDEYIVLEQEIGKGNLPGIRGITMELDLNGQIWIGTSDGLVVYYSPDNIFEIDQRDAERILVDNGTDVEILFENTTINDIEVNGSNEKWIATEGFGAYLMSEDGQKVIHHFTSENSPLVSNNVLKIAIDDISGEVFFATGKGIVSYRGSSVQGSEDLSAINIFPNPVRPDFQGSISISGLMDQSTVKITDINGRLVNELISRGGQVIWNGLNFENEEVSTGVYLVFISGENEEENLKTQIGKILYQR